MDDKRMATFKDSALNMLQMLIDFSFGNAHVNGNLPRRQRISLKERYDIPPDRLLPLERDSGFFWSSLHVLLG